MLSKEQATCREKKIERFSLIIRKFHKFWSFSGNFSAGLVKRALYVSPEKRFERIFSKTLQLTQRERADHRKKSTNWEIDFPVTSYCTTENKKTTRPTPGHFPSPTLLETEQNIQSNFRTGTVLGGEKFNLGSHENFITRTKSEPKIWRKLFCTGDKIKHLLQLQVLMINITQRAGIATFPTSQIFQALRSRLLLVARDRTASDQELHFQRDIKHSIFQLQITEKLVFRNWCRNKITKAIQPTLREWVALKHSRLTQSDH